MLEENDVRRKWLVCTSLVLAIIGTGVIFFGRQGSSSRGRQRLVVDEQGAGSRGDRAPPGQREQHTQRGGWYVYSDRPGGRHPGHGQRLEGCYYCAKVEGVIPPASSLSLTLRLYQTNDNPDYEWIPPTGSNSCYSCKPGVTQIWLDNDAHARSGNNPRFFSLYNGTDITGTSVITPGYKLDFPGTAGNCATCHAPGAAVNAPFTTDMNLLSGIDRDFGVHCDFCHKVADVYLNPATGLPYPNAPGVISMDIRRPFPNRIVTSSSLAHSTMIMCLKKIPTCH